MKNKVIIFFTRIPTLGKTKTRLESFLNKDLCVKLQTAFIKDIYNNIKDMGIEIIISYSDHGELKVLRDIIGEDICFLKQRGKDLGEKMYNAISFSLKRYNNAVLIGSDLPLINKNDIEIAFKILETKDIVISPTYDGGYYLIGMKDENKDIFNIRYSTSSVFRETIDKITNLQKSFGEGNIQLDIDDKNDFLKLYEILNKDKSISCENTRKLVNEIMEKCDKYE
ncbi:TIGR04282 family arsenosugar biosynthesis glycosyltransferase [Tissierella pigra]|uniref:Glycosyltransferase n=1 Tax=Tissierella pigra TaxID=2607614 RepID=A0A6N7XV24_9FIRM|nr:TIGR04282 family arsenosugar biosynthesis glycosyltransferase [Tissierella pigra]MBU5428303.1 TIGR04282 family arsenosugar biosynthesis glycosyltransferase [Tissierella pigra]MSU01627.1 glycosyltransferase [Tissierella pigra]